MYNREYTPERILELKENEIFVFGSNLAGAHGGGAARFAYERFGAVWSEGVGLHGQTYAIPTIGIRDVTALRCSEPLRYKVVGPSKVFAMVVRDGTALIIVKHKAHLSL